MDENNYILYFITFIFSALLIAAAACDVWKFVIPNVVSVGIFCLFFLAANFVPIQTQWLSHLGGAAVVLIVGLVVYHFRLLGAGDVKLITAVSLWAGFAGLPLFLFYMALAGGTLSVGLVLLRHIILTVQLHRPNSKIYVMPPMLRHGESIPYGLAIAIGGLSQVITLPHLLLLA